MRCSGNAVRSGDPGRPAPPSKQAYDVSAARDALARRLRSTPGDEPHRPENHSPAATTRVSGCIQGPWRPLREAKVRKRT